MRSPPLGPFWHDEDVFTGRQVQITNNTARNVSRAAQGVPAPRELQEACQVLQGLRTLGSRVFQPAQARIIHALIDLHKQLLADPDPFQNSSLDVSMPVTSCPFQQEMREAGEGSWQGHGQLVEDVLELSLMALGKLQQAFVQWNQVSGSSVTVTSSSAVVMLSSQNASTLPLSSFAVGGPAPVRLGFPSATALEELLKRHPGVSVQVTGLAFNPFEDLDDKNIVGSVGTVLLSSDHKLLHVHGLMEDIEIMLWRNNSLDTHPTSLNLSTSRFVIALNVTSTDKTLLVSLQPEAPLSVTLHLGFQQPPEPTSSPHNITLPRDQVWQKDEEYTWVLTPESLQYGTGTYYITAVLEGDTQSTLVSVVTAVTQCYFWNSHERAWKSNGCQVGARSTVRRTQCLCNHLTFFGSDFFILPRTVNVEDTVQLFLRVSSNPVGVSLLASLLAFYATLALWAWRKDQADAQKVKVTMLADSDPGGRFHYLIQVYTGYRRRAATTAKVVLTLYGSEGRSEPHHLADPHKPVFERGALDVFLLATRSPLGQLHSLRLWHDNSGASPAWYVTRVVVSDLTLQRKWHFLCHCWLAVDLGDCERDRIFLPASHGELLSFRHLFPSVMVEKFTQDYLWLSVATRHPWSPFTRVQRLSCCVTLLLCNMLINVMFWKANAAVAGQEAPMGPLAVTWSELRISLQTAVILFPINLVVGRLFPLTQPQEALPPAPQAWAPCLSDAPAEPPSLTEVIEELRETVGFLLRRPGNMLPECEHPPAGVQDVSELVKLLSSLVCSQLKEQGSRRPAGPRGASAAPENQRLLSCYLLGVVERLQSRLGALSPSQVPSPGDVQEAASQLRRLRDLLRTRTVPVEQDVSREVTCFPLLSPEAERNPSIAGWCQRLSYASWTLLSVAGLAAAFFTALYSLDLNKDQASSWVVSMMLSVVQNIFISQPVKVVILTFGLSLLMKRVPWLNRESEQQTRRILALAAKCSSSPPASRDRNNPVYVAPTMHGPARCPAGAVGRRRICRIAAGIMVQTLFLVLLMTRTYSAQNSNRFYLHQAIRKSLAPGFAKIRLLEEFYPWARHSLLPHLFGDGRGFITDGNCFLLGNILLRQIRTPGAPPCDPGAASQQQPGDTEGCSVSWGPPEANNTAPGSPWHPQDEETQHDHPIQGEFATYSGGSYAVRLGRNSTAAARVLQHLQQWHWLDRRTRVLCLEFVVFNANVNLLCTVTLTLESSDVGALFSSVSVDSLPALQASQMGIGWDVISQVLYHLLVCYYAFVQGWRLKCQGWRFLTQKRNVLDTSVVLISFVILALDMTRISLHQKHMAQHRQDPDGFVSFSEALSVNCATTYLVGILVLLATLQLWHLLHHDARLQVISRTLSKAWDEVTGFLLIILVLLTGYAIAFNLLFGWSISNYRTFINSAVTVVGLLVGVSHHKEVIALDPVLGGFLTLTSVVLMVLVIINLFVSAILMAFGRERKSLKRETTLIDVLLHKLSGLLGIRRHQQPRPPRPCRSAGRRKRAMHEERRPCLREPSSRSRPVASRVGLPHSRSPHQFCTDTS
ncbi:polycystin-1-like protein 3 [Ochotona princeps]|uniref:polycystin-1-like protein 3 n=1 Tax=Ochotona princeps TaxID=9978 RepID=UPI0027146C51|nr:polycystin-1-like protein 3 [Ochotona princeps]